MKLGDMMKAFRAEHKYTLRLATLDPAPDLPNITTDFSGMYSKLSPERKNVFWKAFLDHVTVTREKEASIAFHNAKVLAERMGMIEMQEK